MNLAFCIFKFFPYGGLQRDFLMTIKACLARGHQVTVMARSWEGEMPSGVVFKKIRTFAITNHTKAVQFEKKVNAILAHGLYDGVIGFNRMSGLDVYFAGDNCVAERTTQEKGLWGLMNFRYRTYNELERAVFDPRKKTQVLLLTERQKEEYIRNYQTQPERFHLLPPGVADDRRRPPNAITIRNRIRSVTGVAPDSKVLIQVGSGFITKGLDRSIRAIAALPLPLRNKTRLWVVGRDRVDKFAELSHKLGISEQIYFFGGRDDIPELLQGADLMIHPAVNEATGTVLIEALASGLPVLCSGVCGYADHVVKSEAGRVTAEPFVQEDLNRELEGLLTRTDLSDLGNNGVRYVERMGVGRRHEMAVDIIESTLRALRS